MTTEKMKDFKSKYEPKYKLKKYEEEIKELLADGYSQEQILFYLSEYQNVKVSLRTLTRQIAHIKKTNSKTTVRTVENTTVRTVQKSESGIKKEDNRPPISQLMKEMRERRQDD